ncbi:MAG: hypothetical protein JNK99_15600 [Candidatus Accumulibacter sp.]|uniref:hypothetical protein n=1 Tax=Accumulibacter sp. TaxID=2053492 RepID=UPI001A4A5E87|nr:hypothetical protein [Accumulibacter sp.]MBL8396144.1 hypothetical protein [Accumulibacter sp.]
MNTPLPAPAGSLAFSGISLDLSRQSGQDWLTNRVLGRCLGTNRRVIQNIIDRHPEAFTEADTRLVDVDLMTHCESSNTEKRGPGTGAKTTRIWSFPEGCLKVALFATTDQAKAFGLFVLAHLQRQAEHWRLKALQREHYIYSKRPRMRLVAQAADAGLKAADAGLKTRDQAGAAGFRCLESARRNRREALKAGLLATPALPEAAQGELFALTGEA